MEKSVSSIRSISPEKIQYFIRSKRVGISEVYAQTRRNLWRQGVRACKRESSVSTWESGRTRVNFTLEGHI